PAPAVNTTVPTMPSSRTSTTCRRQRARHSAASHNRANAIALRALVVAPSAALSSERSPPNCVRRRVLTGQSQQERPERTSVLPTHSPGGRHPLWLCLAAELS